MLGQGKKEGSESTAVHTIIGQQSRVEGNIHFTGSLHIDGEIKGNIIAKAKVNGDVYYNLIEMAMGAQVNGSLIHRDESSSSVVKFGRDATGTTESDE
jgi:cytoskeletal protein CcmA (bactofilin family)